MNRFPNLSPQFVNSHVAGSADGANQYRAMNNANVPQSTVMTPCSASQLNRDVGNALSNGGLHQSRDFSRVSDKQNLYSYTWPVSAKNFDNNGRGSAQIGHLVVGVNQQQQVHHMESFRGRDAKR